MKKHIICFGDSNTYGYCADPADCADGGGRFNEEERWPRLLQTKLGDDYLVIEEGLPGRTTAFDDPLHEGLAGVSYITPCLKSHEVVDLLIIMLGTNDTKDRFAQNAYGIGRGMERLVRKAYATDCWGGKKPNVLVVAPPPIQKGMLTSTIAEEMGKNCVEISEGVAEKFKNVCELLGTHFLDAAHCEFNQVDYMHLSAKGHTDLADTLAEVVPTLLQE